MKDAGAGSASTTQRPGKRERHRAILELVARRAIATQEELVAALSGTRHVATQATVSRDLRELGLVRIHDGGGMRYVPAVPERTEHSVPLARAIAEHVRSIEFVDQLGVIRSWPATAPLLAGAIDAAGLDEVAGTVAGDDTVLVIARGRVAARRLQERFASMRREL